MNNIKYLTLIFFLINSCSSIKLDCKPEVRDFFYHTNSSVCMFQIGDTVSERYMNTRNLYDTIIPFNSCFIIDGDNIVFEYNYHAKQCITEPYWQYFLFQIPSYLTQFKVQNEDLKYLHCDLDLTCQRCGCFDWSFKEGTIGGKKINDST
jgi:hypothetical protein